MSKGLIAAKIAMTSIFEEDGAAVPVTILHAEKNRVLQVKDKNKDGYDAVQLGCVPKRKNLLTKSELGHQKTAEKPLSVLHEFRDFGKIKRDDEVGVDIFEVGMVVSVTGYSKGKGFQGVMKRHGFGGGRASHGSGFHRKPGSLSASAYPSRVFKGKALPGRMGSQKTTVQNLKVVAVDADQNFLLVKGAVPGHRKSYVKVEIKK